jgi:hypothetical protein
MITPTNNENPRIIISIIFYFLVLLCYLVFIKRYTAINGIYTDYDFPAFDGFYIQLIQAYNNLATGDIFSASLIEQVYVIRSLVYAPFFFVESLPFSGIYYSIFILLSALPLIFYTEVKWRVWIPALLLLPIFISIRTYLVGCGIAYLFLFIFGHKKCMFLLSTSLLFSVLSSATLFIWISVVVINFRTLLCRRRILISVLLFLAICLLTPSILHKLHFMNQTTNILLEYTSRSSLLLGLATNTDDGASNRLFVRTIAYGFLAISNVIIFVSSINKRRIRFGLSFVPFLLASCFEGLGLISSAPVIFLFIIGFRNRPRGAVRG